MICQRKDCGGEINTAVFEELVTRSPNTTLTSPCGKCGLLHFLSGLVVIQRGTGAGAFLVEGKGVE